VHLNKEKQELTKPQKSLPTLQTGVETHPSSCKGGVPCQLEVTEFTKLGHLEFILTQQNVPSLVTRRETQKVAQKSIYEPTLT
jgi:hypothetical protein